MIEATSSGDVAILLMAHGKANAMSIEFCQALTERFDELGTSAARAVVVTGKGRIFSAGVDLPRLLDGGAPYVREFLPALNRMFATIFSYPKPVVAAVNGHAIAGGCVLACACDRRLMSNEAGRIGVAELLVGVPFPVIAGRGLVDEVVDPGLLLDRAVAAAQKLAALSPAAFALSKRQTRQPALERVRDGGAIDAEVTQIWTAPETLDRIRDYVSRTFKKS